MGVKIGLALGSGGMRGLAHVGVLKVLERENIPIDCIAGCSIGSLIGALYCAGLKPDVIFKLAKHIKRRHWLDFIVPKMGLIAGDRVLDTIRILTKKKSFADLDIPLAIVATDLLQGKEIVFNEGEVAAAVRASISVPGVFVPFQYQGMLLVDGAVLSPTPIDIVRKMGAEIVIAVDLAHQEINSKIDNIFDVIIQSIDIMERELFASRQKQLCDILISPNTAHISPSAFDSVDECVSLGEIAAVQVLPQLRLLLGEHVSEHKPANGENLSRLISDNS